MEFQEAIDKAMRGISEQGRLSYSYEFEDCMYRCDDNSGTTCIIGQLIADEDYDRRMEACGIAEEPTGKPVSEMNGEDLVYRAVSRTVGRNLSRNEVYILTDLQTAHDDAAGDDMIPVQERMRDFFREAEDVLVDHDLHVPADVLAKWGVAS